DTKKPGPTASQPTGKGKSAAAAKEIAQIQQAVPTIVIPEYQKKLVGTADVFLNTLLKNSDKAEITEDSLPVHIFQSGSGNQTGSSAPQTDKGQKDKKPATTGINAKQGNKGQEQQEKNNELAQSIGGDSGMPSISFTLKLSQPIAHHLPPNSRCNTINISVLGVYSIPNSWTQQAKSFLSNVTAIQTAITEKEKRPQSPQPTTQPSSTQQTSGKGASSAVAQVVTVDPIVQMSSQVDPYSQQQYNFNLGLGLPFLGSQGNQSDIQEGNQQGYIECKRIVVVPHGKVAPPPQNSSNNQDFSQSGCQQLKEQQLSQSILSNTEISKPRVVFPEPLYSHTISFDGSNSNILNTNSAKSVQTGINAKDPNIPEPLYSQYSSSNQYQQQQHGITGEGSNQIVLGEDGQPIDLIPPIAKGQPVHICELIGQQFPISTQPIISPFINCGQHSSFYTPTNLSLPHNIASSNVQTQGSSGKGSSTAQAAANQGAINAATIAAEKEKASQVTHSIQLNSSGNPWMQARSAAQENMIISAQAQSQQSGTGGQNIQTTSGSSIINLFAANADAIPPSPFFIPINSLPEEIPSNPTIPILIDNIPGIEQTIRPNSRQQSADNQVYGLQSDAPTPGITNQIIPPTQYPDVAEVRPCTIRRFLFPDSVENLYKQVMSGIDQAGIPLQSFKPNIQDFENLMRQQLSNIQQQEGGGQQIALSDIQPISLIEGKGKIPIVPHHCLPFIVERLIPDHIIGQPGVGQQNVIPEKGKGAQEAAAKAAAAALIEAAGSLATLQNSPQYAYGAIPLSEFAYPGQRSIILRIPLFDYPTPASVALAQDTHAKEQAQLEAAKNAQSQATQVVTIPTKGSKATSGDSKGQTDKATSGSGKGVTSSAQQGIDSGTPDVTQDGPRPIERSQAYAIVQIVLEKPLVSNIPIITKRNLILDNSSALIQSQQQKPGFNQGSSNLPKQQQQQQTIGIKMPSDLVQQSTLNALLKPIKVSSQPNSQSDRSNSPNSSNANINQQIVNTATQAAATMGLLLERRLTKIEDDKQSKIERMRKKREIYSKEPIDALDQIMKRIISASIQFSDEAIKLEEQEAKKQQQLLIQQQQQAAQAAQQPRQKPPPQGQKTKQQNKMSGSAQSSQKQQQGSKLAGDKQDKSDKQIEKVMEPTKKENDDSEFDQKCGLSMTSQIGLFSYERKKRIKNLLSSSGLGQLLRDELAQVMDRDLRRVIERERSEQDVDELVKRGKSKSDRGGSGTITGVGDEQSQQKKNEDKFGSEEFTFETKDNTQDGENKEGDSNNKKKKGTRAQYVPTTFVSKSLSGQESKALVRASDLYTSALHRLHNLINQIFSSPGLPSPLKTRAETLTDTQLLAAQAEAEQITKSDLVDIYVLHDFAVKLNLVGQLEEAKDAFLDAILAMMPIDNKGNEKDKEALLKSSIDKGEGINSIPIASFIGL
ncbi:MAG: hypothetical protein EZS28_024618, partial [Streblomastix strix]